jgi:hypothetical protein
MNRKRVILVALLGVLAVCLFYAYFATPRLEKVSPRESSQKSRTSSGAKNAAVRPAGGEERIDFDFLSKEPQEFPGAKRDIFRFVTRPPVRTEPPAVAAKPPAPPPVEKPVETATENPDDAPIKAVQKSLGKFTFLGFLDKAGEKTIFLSDGKNLYLVKRGESFGGYKVADIAGNLLKVASAGWDGLLEIPLIEKQKLSVSVSAPARREPRPEAPVPQPPQERVARPRNAPPQKNAEQTPGTSDENNPEAGQPEESPAEGDVIEGDVNATNQ